MVSPKVKVKTNYSSWIQRTKKPNTSTASRSKPPTLQRLPAAITPLRFQRKVLWVRSKRNSKTWQAPIPRRARQPRSWICRWKAFQKFAIDPPRPPTKRNKSIKMFYSTRLAIWAVSLGSIEIHAKTRGRARLSSKWRKNGKRKMLQARSTTSTTCPTTNRCWPATGRPLPAISL